MMHMYVGCRVLFTVLLVSQKHKLDSLKNYKLRDGNQYQRIPLSPVIVGRSPQFLIYSIKTLPVTVTHGNKLIPILGLCNGVCFIKGPAQKIAYVYWAFAVDRPIHARQASVTVMWGSTGWHALHSTCLLFGVRSQLVKSQKC